MMACVFTPMLVTSGRLPSNGDKYAFEVKWDGFRALITAGPGSVSITSRNGHDMTPRYGELRTLHDAVVKPVVLDGEIVVLDGDGRPDFAALWFRNRSSSRKPERSALFHGVRCPSVRRRGSD
jgi:bifunctional non-homologous end joining protein LigD